MIGLIVVVAIWGLAISAGIYVLEARLAKLNEVKAELDEVKQKIVELTDADRKGWRVS